MIVTTKGLQCLGDRTNLSTIASYYTGKDERDARFLFLFALRIHRDVVGVEAERIGKIIQTGIAASAGSGTSSATLHVSSSALYVAGMRR